MVGKCLKLCLNTHKNIVRYKQTHNTFRDFNKFFIIDNNDAVLKTLSRLNRARGTKSINSFDFKNLYTCIPHDKLKENIRKFVTKVFKDKSKMYICVTDRSAYFSDNKVLLGTSFSCENLVSAICTVVDSSYISSNAKTYRQKIGIPMGTSCGPHLANVFLHIYEYEYIDTLIDSKQHDKCMKLKEIFRFQDDCLVLNDNNLFTEIYKDFYPSELTLKNTNTSSSKTNYLDLTISIYQGRFRYISYDKRRSYNFDVINYPDLNGNVPIKASYGVFISELRRFCINNSVFKSFKFEVKNMIYKLINQGYSRRVLLNYFKVFCERYINLWSRYGVDITERKVMKTFFN